MFGKKEKDITGATTKEMGTWAQTAKHPRQCDIILMDGTNEADTLSQWWRHRMPDHSYAYRAIDNLTYKRVGMSCKE